MNIMRRSISYGVVLLSVVLLAGCSSGGLGDILGGAGNSNATDIRGTVDTVSTSGGYIDLRNVSGYSSLGGNNTTGSTARVYFDNRTTVEYQGQNHRPEDLERGDEIAVRVTESNGRLVADSISVLRDVSGGATTGGYGSTVRGTVRNVDASRRTIEVDRGGYNQYSVIEFDNGTEVSYNGRSYQPTDLERGDEIDVTVRDLGGGRYVADRINVIRSVGATNDGYGTQTVRGTVRYHDTARRTIELEQASWISGFTTGTGGSVVTIQYDTNSYVEYQGARHATSGLERGDVIEAQVQSLSGGRYSATRIVLLRNARG